MSGLTRVQSEALAFIEGYVAEHGYSPSFSEIKEAMGLASKASVNRLMNNLEDRGRIRRISGRARSIEVVEETAEYHLRQILGVFDADRRFLWAEDRTVTHARAWVERRRS